MNGLNLPYRSASRRQRTLGTLDAGRTQAARRQAHVKGLLKLGGTLVGEGPHRVEQTLQLLSSFDRATAGDLLYEMATTSAQQGDLPTSSQALRQLAARYPDHELVDAALLQLVKHHTSDELHWTRVARETEDAQVRLATADAPVADPLWEVSPSVNRIGTHIVASNPWRTGFQLGRQLKTKRPHLYAEPSVLFPLAAIARMDGQQLSATAFYRRAMALPIDSEWRRRAAAELALQEDPTAADLVCVKVSRRPHLDGDLSDDCWQQATFVPLVDKRTSTKNEEATVFAISHDESYLYVGVQSRKALQTRYLPHRRPRPRDADLRDRDRVVLTLDTNRDYVSWYKLEVDHRGWTHESLLDDRTWNPNYFVASTATESIWSLEIAIPLEELASPDRRSDSHWAVGMSRIVPRQRVERWNPRDRNRPPKDLQGILRLE